MKLSVPMTPASLCNTRKSLVIPIYQRLFVWGEEQIMNLLQDLCASCQKGKDKHYHLGAITVHENEKQQWEIVDGQQRLTFLTLLGCELIRISKVNNANWADCWDKFLWQDDTKKHLRLFFNGRKDDRDDILKFLKMEKGKDTIFTKPAFKRFAEFFREFVDKLSYDALQTFSQYCFDHAAFLVNELPRGYRSDELNLHFEKMNSTGRQLSPLEVVKGKWFAPLAARWNRCMNFDVEFIAVGGNEVKTVENATLSLKDVLAENYAFDNSRNAGSEDKPVKSRLVMRPEILALHALCCLYRRKGLMAPSIQRQRLIETFQTAFHDGFIPVECLVELENYRAWVDKNIVYLQDTEGDLDYAFRAVAEVNKPDIRMKQFQTMLHVSSGEAQEWVLKAYLESNYGSMSLSYDELRRMENSWHEALDTSSLRYKRISRYWFWKLDYLLWELHEENNRNSLFSGFDKSEHDAITSYCFSENISIEHLHPQADGNEKWGFRDNPEAAMHQFGNLAMMSVEGNSSQQDDPIQVKFGRVKSWLESGRLESIKMLLMFHLADKIGDGWTVEKAQIHERDMVSILQNDAKRFSKNT